MSRIYTLGQLTNAVEIYGEFLKDIEPINGLNYSSSDIYITAFPKWVTKKLEEMSGEVESGSNILVRGERDE